MRSLPVMLACLLLWGVAAAEGNLSFTAFSYHDVRDDVAGDFDPDQYAIATDNLAAHFRWLHDHGFQPVSISDIRMAAAGIEPLPPRAVLLTFDDGYASHYSHVYPLLRAFGYPAVFSLVTQWLDAPPGTTIQYGSDPLARKDFLTWAQVREMAASGYAEFASHSHNLHLGIEGNPQGNKLPAAVTRAFSGSRYERDQEYRQRIRTDLAASIASFSRETGRKPTVMTWPYGRYSTEVMTIAADLGMDINLTLDPGVGRIGRLDTIPRHLIQANPGPGDFAAMLINPPRASVLRAAHVDLDYLYDEDPVQQAANLDTLLDRMRALQISHVFLQAFADPDADGAAESVYFPNRHMPVRADLFSRVSWQLKTRAEVQVYAWMPVLAFDHPDLGDVARVSEFLLSGPRPDPQGEPRLSPFDTQARRIILEIYEDLARHAQFDGLLFHDDARLNEYEDASPPGRAAFRDAMPAGSSMSDLAGDPALRAAWGRHKQETLTALTLELARYVDSIRPGLKTARNLFADTVLLPESEAWLAQSLSAAMASYDYVALMAMPHLENHDDAGPFLDQLATRAAALPGGPEKIIFELQTVDWRSGKPVPAARLLTQMRRLQSQGIRHLAWYPDDFITGTPDLELLRQGASLADYTHRRP